MSRDFNDDQGGIEKAAETTFDPQEGPTPTTGFTQAPKTKLAEFGPGPGVGNTRGGIR